MIVCFRCLLRSTGFQVRWVSTKRKIFAEFNSDIHENIVNEQMNPKKHPGVMKILPPQIPEKLLEAIKYVLRDKPIKALIKDGVVLTRYLEGRHPPMDGESMKEHVNRIRKTAGKQHGLDIDNLTEEDWTRNKKALNSRIMELYNKYTYNWKPVPYDLHTSLIYLVARAAPEYAVLCRIFSEISTRDKSFQPMSLFDFGSGVGVVSWAAKHFWNNSLKEFFCVDSSSHMNDIAQAIIQGGEVKLEPPKGVYFRQFLPSQNVEYDIVVSAHTLFELPSKQARLETMLNLWQKTGKYFVVVERGTNAGFNLVTEVRDFIIFSRLSRSTGSPIDAHVFSPCPHDEACPRLMENQEGKATPCNFEVNYHQLCLDDRDKIHAERFSYVVIKKESRTDDENQWPRIVRPVIKRSGHCICRFCTAEGKLQEIVFSAAKHGRIPYRCARSSRWGDILPVKLNEKEIVIDDLDDNPVSSSGTDNRFEEEAEEK